MVGIGFDSGGTRTTVAIDRGSGPETVEENETVESISGARDIISVQRAISWMADKIEEIAHGRVAVWIGAAGYSAATASRIVDAFKTELDDRPRLRARNCTILLANDAISILKADPLRGRGVVAIVGTGSVVLGAHPACREGVIKRGGCEWMVSDDGAGVWMTLRCVALLLEDLQSEWASNRHSVLLDRLAEHLRVSVDETQHISPSRRALVMAELIARHLAEPTHTNIKRTLAQFVYPYLFDFARGEGHPFDPVAKQVIKDSVRVIALQAQAVSDRLAASTADDPDRRDKLKMVVGGKIAANSYYEPLLESEILNKTCASIESVRTIGDGSDWFSSLALSYLRADDTRKEEITRPLDELHSVARVL
jgi:N-acetylglucosamine kinase-like BadF-type ATPase